jgi:hypothetical protein
MTKLGLLITEMIERMAAGKRAKHQRGLQNRIIEAGNYTYWPGIGPVLSEHWAEVSDSPAKERVAARLGVMAGYCSPGGAGRDMHTVDGFAGDADAYHFAQIAPLLAK